MKRLILPCLILLALILLVFAATGTTTCILRSQCNSEIAKIRARGEPTSRSELAGPKIPRQRNAAFIYAQASDALDTPTRYDDLNHTLDYFLDPRYERTPRVWSDAETVVRCYDKALTLVPKAIRLPECRFPRDWTDDLGPGAGHLVALHDLGRLIQARALLAARDGRMRDTLADIEMGIRMGESLDEPGLVSQHTRSRMVQAQCRRLHEVLEYGTIDEDDARRLSDLLGTIDLIPRFLRSLREQRAIDLSLFRYVSNNGLTAAFGDVFADWAMQAYKPGRPTVYVDQKVYLRLVNPMIADLSLSYREYKAHGLHSLDKPDPPQYAVLSDMILPGYCPARLRTDEAMAEIGAARIALALTVYKNRHGSYPASLSELKSLGWKLRTDDPFSGTDFVYRRLAKGYILYSLGENLKDDGGNSFDLPPEMLPHSDWPAPPASGPSARPPSPSLRKPNPPYSRQEMPYRTIGGRKSEDIIWESNASYSGGVSRTAIAFFVPTVDLRLR